MSICKLLLSLVILAFCNVTFAQVRCQQQVDDFITVYRSNWLDCKSLGDQAACERVCSQIPSQPAVPVQSVGSCSQTELDSARQNFEQQKQWAVRDARKQVLNQVAEDLKVEETGRASAAGVTG